MAVEVAVSAAAGSVIIVEAVELQPFASVTVTVYVPGAKLDISSFVEEYDAPSLHA